METDLKKENLLIRLRNLLNENDVKLWLSPYYNAEESNVKALEVLAERHYQFLNTDRDTLLKLLQQLQSKALIRLEERNNFKAQGLATIRVKVSSKKLEKFSVQIKLCDVVDTLRKLIAEKIETSEEKLKLVSSGKVLTPQRTLQELNVKHGSVVLVLVLENKVGTDIVSGVQNNYMLLEETRKDVELLLQRQNYEYLTITNQSGAKIDLPREERHSLCLAMSLHGKGQTAFREKRYELALMFFLEADNEFKQCRSDILQMVDNYALLNLDIVWTYLHLRSLQYLSDGEERLKICEKQFICSYGETLERLKNVRGSTGNESVLLTRLRLLQGILLYLSNRKEDAISKFEEVENYMQVLKVDNEKLSTMIALGYSSRESMLALRATFNDLDLAVDYITQNGKKREKNEEFEKIRKYADKYICENGQPINLTIMDQLFNMGFTRLIGVQALKNCNNEINAALLWIENFYRTAEIQYPSHMIDVLKQIEFDDGNTQSILKLHRYRFDDSCVRSLLASRPEFAEQFVLEEQNLDDLVAHSSSENAPSSSGNNKPNSELEETRKEEEALVRLHRGISSFEDEHLIIDLQSEEKFLREYQSLVLKF